MRNISVIVLALTLAAVAGLAFGQLDHPWPAQATHAGGADNFSIDMDPGAAPANTATSIGSVEVCAQINENDIMDADEDAVDTLEFDLVTGPAGIPAGNPMIGFSVSFSYSSANLTVDVDSVDVNFLLASAPGSAVFDASGPAVDPDVFDVAAVDTSDPNSGTAESGPGVLARVTMTSTAAASPGVYPLILTSPAHIDPNNDAFLADNVNDGNVAIDQPCPPPVDLEVTAATVSSPAGASAGSAFDVTVGGTAVNNGPATPVNADVTVTLNVPADCTLDSNSPTVQDLSLTSGTPTEIPPQDFSVTCTNPSFHDFTASIIVAKDDVGALESDEGNNSLTGAKSITAVIADADLEIVEVSVSAPGTVAVGTSFYVQYKVDYRNNGPFGPVDNFVITSVLALPGGCTSYGGSSQAVGVAAVPTSTTFSLHLLWSVTCSQILSHTFAATSDADVAHLHVADPDTTNNTLTGAAPGATVVGPASLPQTGGSSDGSSNGPEGSIVAFAVLTILLATWTGSRLKFRRSRRR